MDIKLKVKKYKDTGDIAWEYNPLRNLKKSDDQIDDFTVSNSQLKLDLENPIDIECQSSYDGSTNLIFNDDKNPPRLINTRFTPMENNTYKIINRIGNNDTNIYDDEQFEIATQQLGGLITWPDDNVLNNCWHYEIIGNVYENPEMSLRL